MFEFLQHIGTYESRKIALDEFDWGFVSTVRVSDGTHPIETAVNHPRYNEGHTIVVEAYDTVEQAENGHTKWVTRMTRPELPEKLVDCQNASIAQLLGALSEDGTITYYLEDEK